MLSPVEPQVTSARMSYLLGPPAIELAFRSCKPAVRAQAFNTTAEPHLLHYIHATATATESDRLCVCGRR